MSTAPKQIHVAAGFPGVNNTTVWSDPAAGSQIAFESFRHLAQTAERGKFDPVGLNPFVEKVIPLLQEWGVYRTDYEGETLRDHLGLASTGLACTGLTTTGLAARIPTAHAV